MRKINIKAVKDGMVLAEPLKNAHGGLLLDKGTTISEAFAGRLAQRGITTLCVVGEPESGDEVVAVAPFVEVRRVSLEDLFDGKIENKSMYMIYEALLKRRERDQNG